MACVSVRLVFGDLPPYLTYGDIASPSDTQSMLWIRILPNDADPSGSGSTTLQLHMFCLPNNSSYADALGPDPTGLGVADIRQQNIETQAPAGPTHSYNSKLIRFPLLVDQNRNFLMRGQDRLFCLTKQVLGKNFNSFKN
jgi:hypothetical protein